MATVSGGGSGRWVLAVEIVVLMGEGEGRHGL